MKQTTVYIPEEIDQAIDEWVAASRQSEDLPSMSRSDVIRRLLQSGVEESDDLLDLLPEDRRIMLQREEVVESNRLADLRGGFRGRARQQLQERFRNGYQPEDVAEWAGGLIKEARVLWPDDAERRQEEVAFVEELVEDYRDAYDASEYDQGDPFGSFEGVEEGRDIDHSLDVEEADALIMDAARRLRSGAVRDTEAVTTALTNDKDLTETEAKRVVERAVARLGNGTGGEGA